MMKTPAFAENILHKNTFFYSALRIVVVLALFNIIGIFMGILPGFIPIPVKCSVPVLLGRAQYDVGVDPQISPPPDKEIWSKEECYPFYRSEFWRSPTLDLMLRPIFSLSGNDVEFLKSFSYETPRIALIHPSYPANYDDNAILVGASHNVFVGKVIAQVGTKDFVGNPATQFSVEIITHIKGDLKDTVVVNQEGGYRNGVLYLMEESGGLLVPGSTYLSWPVFFRQ